MSDMTMPGSNALSSRSAVITRDLLRIIAGGAIAQHGAQKLFGVLGGFGGVPGATAPLASLMGVAGILEFVGGLLLLFGLFTRPVAFLLAGEMAGAYFMAHLPKGFWPIMNGGELAVVNCFVFLSFVASGAGPWSLDAVLRGRRG